MDTVTFQSTSAMPVGYYSSLMHSDYSVLTQAVTSTSLARLEDNAGDAVAQLVQALRYKTEGRWSSNPGASTSWNPQGLSRSVQGLLYHTMKAYRRSRCTAHLNLGTQSGEMSTSHPANNHYALKDNLMFFSDRAS